MSLTRASSRRPEVAGAPALEMRARVLERLPKAVAAERLQQVVERVHLERAERVLVVGGDEDDRRHLLGTDGLDDAEAVDTGHLHVEEHQVGHLVLNRRDGLRAVAALAHHFDVVLLLQQRQHALARDRLVVDDQGSDPAHATLSIRSRNSGPGSGFQRLWIASQGNDDRHEETAAGRGLKLEPMTVAVQVLEPGSGVGQPDARVKRIQLVGRHADAVVAHRQHQAATDLTGVDVHAADADSAVRCRDAARSRRAAAE